MNQLKSVLLFLFLTLIVSAQDMEQKFDIPVRENGQLLADPWIGGMSRPMYFEGDINNDNVDDIIAFELRDGKIYTFLYEDQGYQYAPIFENNFPTFSDWAIFEDYNCDGIIDVFGFIEFVGIIIYEGHYDEFDRIAFTLVEEGLNSDIGELLYADADDPIKVIDVDNDGDKDILTISLNAENLYYYENLSQDMGYGCDSLIYNFQSPCWGDFRMPFIQDSIIFNIDCDVDLWEQEEKNIHAVPKITVIDIDGDTDKDLLLGYILGEQLNLLENKGDEYFEEFDTILLDYPFDAPVRFAYGATANSVDMDKDGDNDLMITRARLGDAGLGQVDMLYQNTGTDAMPIFEFEKENFFAEDMIDLGGFSKPALLDYNNDGLQDIIVSSYYGVDSLSGSNYFVSLYENTGTLQNPEFELITHDFAGLASIQKSFIRFTFGDLDDDGDSDMIYGCDDGTLTYYSNDNGVFTHVGEVGEDVGSNSTPQLIDVNMDELLDIIVGETNGNLNYFKNIGTANTPEFMLVSDFWGEIDVREQFAQGYSEPALYHLPDTNDIELIVGNILGKVKRYDFDYNMIESGMFTLLDSSVLDINKSLRSSPVITDIDGDFQLDILEGNNLGGLVHFEEKDLFVGTNSPQNEAENIHLLSNLIDEKLMIFVGENHRNFPTVLSIFDPLGRLRHQQFSSSFDANFSIEVDIQNLESGYYFLQILQDETQKFYTFLKI